MSEKKRREEAEKWEAVERVRKGEGVVEVSRSVGVSRVTLYEWKRRVEERGLMGLEGRSKRPLRLRWMVGRRKWEQRLRLGRERYPTWGSKKLRVWLMRQFEEEGVPSVSSLSRMLREAGLSRRSRWRRRGPQVERVYGRVARQSNEVWAVDFKGAFRLGDGSRCDTLTVTDLASRYVLCCEVMKQMSFELVQREMIGVMRRYGMPEAIRVDNGQPFSSPGPLGLSKLSVWWERLGIGVEQIRPGCPQDNGCHERMHRTLQEEIARHPAKNSSNQKRRFRRWRQCFNHDRPHEALGMRVPADVYEKSPRPYRAPKAISYPKDWAVRQVRSGGEIKWQGQRRYVGEAFSGQQVGVAVKTTDLAEVYLDRLLIGVLNPHDKSGLRPSVSVRSYRSHL